MHSSIAHAGYLLLGLVVLSNQGLLAILIYFSVYLLMNLGAFLVVMLIANKTGSEDIHDYNGLGHTSPFLGISLAIFLVSLTGLPPTAGFIGKLYIFIALVDAKMIAVAVIALEFRCLTLLLCSGIETHVLDKAGKRNTDCYCFRSKQNSGFFSCCSDLSIRNLFYTIG